MEKRDSIVTCSSVVEQSGLNPEVTGSIPVMLQHMLFRRSGLEEASGKEG